VINLDYSDYALISAILQKNLTKGQTYGIFDNKSNKNNYGIYHKSARETTRFMVSIITLTFMVTAIT